jgi:UDP-N-acetyl-D-mannosaminuronate dehydrogenase
MNPTSEKDVRALDEMRFELIRHNNRIKQINHTISKNKVIQSSNQFSFQPSRVVVIGLGQLGLPVAKYVKEHGFDTYGYDINQKAMQSAEAKYGIKQATNFGDFDVLIICVSTHRQDDMFSPQVDGLMSVVEKISREAKTGALISIESTIPKGTSKRVFEKLDHRLHVVHAPHRWYALEEEIHGVNQLRIVGGVSSCCLQHGLNFYDGRRAEEGVIVSSSSSSSSSATTSINRSLSTAPTTTSSSTARTAGTTAAETTATRPDNKYNIVKRSLAIPMHPVSSVEVAELTKIVENAHRYLQIAFAEELYLYCKSNGISFPELRESLNTKWNVEILEPRDGIGGHCLPKDTKMFINSSNTIKSKILQAAMEIDEDYSEYRKIKDNEVTIPAI